MEAPGAVLLRFVVDEEAQSRAGELPQWEDGNRGSPRPRVFEGPQSRLEHQLEVAQEGLVRWMAAQRLRLAGAGSSR